MFSILLAFLHLATIKMHTHRLTACNFFQADWAFKSVKSHHFLGDADEFIQGLLAFGTLLFLLVAFFANKSLAASAFERVWAGVESTACAFEQVFDVRVRRLKACKKVENQEV